MNSIPGFALVDQYFSSSTSIGKNERHHKPIAWFQLCNAYYLVIVSQHLEQVEYKFRIVGKEPT